MRNRVTQALSIVDQALASAAALSALAGSFTHWVQKDPLNIEATRPQGTPVYTFQQLQNDQSRGL